MKSTHTLSSIVARVGVGSLFVALTCAPALQASASTVPIPANPPQSYCVTSYTKQLHASAQTTMEKDIANYAGDSSLANAISAYTQEIDTAWSAMEQPYCGYGGYGITSAIHSYQKSVERARTAFLDAVKGHPTAHASLIGEESATVQAQAAVALKTPTKTSEDPTTKTVPQAKPSTTAVAATGKHVYHGGLHRGIRSDEVLTLQKFLLAHFGVKATSDNATGYFGPLTESYVLKFQIEQHVVAGANSPGAGLVGPKTSAALNAIQ